MLGYSGGYTVRRPLLSLHMRKSFIAPALMLAVLTHGGGDRHIARRLTP